MAYIFRKAPLTGQLPESLEGFGAAGNSWASVDRQARPAPAEAVVSLNFPTATQGPTWPCPAHQKGTRLPWGLMEGMCVGGRSWQGGQLRDLCNSHSLLRDCSRTITVAPPLGVNQNAESLGCPHLSFRAYSQGSLLDTSGHKTQTSSKYRVKPGVC